MNSSRSVFILSREYPPTTVGGTSTVARNLATGLVAEGWRVAVVTTHAHENREVREEIDGVTVLRAATGLVYNTGTGLGGESLRVHRRMHAAAERLAAETGIPGFIALPDLFCLPEASMFARAHSVPLVNILLQDFRAITPYDRGAHRVTSGVTADRGHLLAVEEKALRGSDCTVFISQALSDAITGYYAGPYAPHRVVHLGVDPAEIAEVAADRGRLARRSALLGPGPASGALLVACGRLVPVKGFAPLLTALARLGPVGRRGAPQVLPHLALVGEGPEMPNLRRQATELGLADRVTFLGDIPRHEALGWMSVADVAVVPSLWESFCYVCAEMMAFGRPVVASAVDSLRELMPSDSFGYPVPVGGPSGARTLDPADLTHALRAVLTDPEEAAIRGERARRRILQDFTNERFARELSDLGHRLAKAGAHG
jgi:glycosyltransferase involved in cell wall biosynthesis